MITFITSIIGLSVSIAIILLIRNDRLHVMHGLGWLGAAIVMGALGFAPSIFDSIAIKLGVTYPPTLAFSIGFALIILKLLFDDIDRSRLRMRQTRLIQRVAMLENELRREKKRNLER